MRKHQHTARSTISMWRVSLGYTRKKPRFISPFLSTTEWKRLRGEIWIEEKGLCEYCGCLTIPGHEYLNFNIDHIKPINHKTSTKEQVFDRSNLQLLCMGCHLKKTNEEVATKQKQVYYVDEETGNILTHPPQSRKEYYYQDKIKHVKKLIREGKIKIL